MHSLAIRKLTHFNHGLSCCNFCISPSWQRSPRFLLWSLWFFWGLLASTQSFDEPFDLWGDVSFHTLNAVFALFEIILTNIPALPWLLVLPTEAVLAAYLGIAYITRQTQGFYPYPFLDPSEQGPFLAVYIIGMGVIQFIFFTIVRFTAVLRSKLRRQPRSAQPPPQDVESLEKGQDVESTKLPLAI